MNKKGDKIISVYWFIILFIVTGAIVYMAILFYGAPYDAREAETRILTNQIADCLSEGGYLKEDILGNEDFKNNFLQRCNLNFNVEDVYGWKEQGQYYLSVDFYEFNQNAVNSLGNKVFNVTAGNVNLKTFTVLKAEEKGREIDTIIIHYTEGLSAEDAINAIRDAGLSVHYMVDRRGFVISKENEGDVAPKGLFEGKAFKDESKKADHAGCYDTRRREKRVSCDGEKPVPGEICCVDVNKNSIGIELVNLGNKCSQVGDKCENREEINGEIWEAFPEEQMESLVSLVSDIISRHNIPLDRNHIIGHNEVAPGYKLDPGPAFNWTEFMERLRSEEKLSPFVGRSFYVLDKESGKPYVIKILAIVRKTEKNVA